MKTRKIGKRTKLIFTYFEWVDAGKPIPMIAPEFEIEGEIQFVINDAPEDKKDYFESLGWLTRLAINKSKGMKIT